MITSLTPEQEALILVVKAKWRRIALDSSPTDREKAEIAINKLYKSADLRSPQKIEWFDNPLDACLWLGEKLDGNCNLSLHLIEWYAACSIDGLVERNLHTTIKWKLSNNYYESFTSSIIYNFLESMLKNYLSDSEWFYFQDIIGHSLINYYDNAIIADYYNTINIKHHGISRNWEEIAYYLGFGLCWALRDLAVVTSKPSVIKLDDNLKLHAEGVPAFEYNQKSVITDEKIKLYAYHGNILPEKYGLVHPTDWQAQWLSKEKDSKLTWILAREIGYHKLTQEFSVSEIRTWSDNNLKLFHKCTLLRVQNNPDGIFFLKIISFNQDKIYFCLLPKNISLVRQAEIWIKNTIYSKFDLDYVIKQLVAI